MRPGPRGCVELAILENPDRKDFILGAVNHPTARASVVTRFLREKGIDISFRAIDRHRRGECQCRVE